MTIRSDLPARITGMEISAETSIDHLRAVGCDVTVEGDALMAVVPPWRPDLD